MPPFTQFSAVILAGGPAEAAVHARRSGFETLLASLEARYHLLRLHLHPSHTDVRAAQWRGWTIRPLYTYYLRLADLETLMGLWSSSTRRTYRRAKDAYRVAEDEAAGAVVARHCAQSYERHGRRPPLAPDRLAALIDALASEGTARIYSVTERDTGETHGALAVLVDERTACYWALGSEPGDAMTVLLGETLPLLYTHGVELFDFVGANTASIAEFKRKFGPTLVPYFRLEHATRPELRLLTRLRG